MKNLLVVGAGKSSLFLIEYLLRHAATEGWTVTVADAFLKAAEEKIAGNPHGRAVALDATNAPARRALVSAAGLVLSLLPPTLHTLLAEDCVAEGRSIITASYVSPEMRALDGAFREKGLLAMCEMGLDPGIDHMSAMEIIHRIQQEGGKLEAFVSACGGLVAPESDDNPWHYKFSWNPMNVVSAGRDGAVYMQNGRETRVEYERLFEPQWARRIAGAGIFGAYPNRNSVPYAALYGVPDIPTLIRLTFRDMMFMAGWTWLVGVGFTANDSTDRLATTGLSAAGFTAFITACPPGTDPRVHIASQMNTDGDGSDTWEMLDEQLTSIGLFSTEALASYGVPAVATPAEVLYHLLLRAWAMRPEDKDMVVMRHEFDWRDAAGKMRRTLSTLVLKGENAERTAMAKTVGLPMGILARMMMRGEVAGIAGVQIPTMPEVYGPVLRELEREGIVFSEEES